MSNRASSKQPRRALCLHAPSEHDADMRYATRGFVVGDPIFWMRCGAHSYLLASTLEVGRARAHGAARNVVDLADAVAGLRRRGKLKTGNSHAELLAAFVRSKGVEIASVPARFPVATADALRAAGVAVEVARDSLFPEREVKTADEVAAIRRSQAANEEALDAALHILRTARRRKGLLYHAGEKVTAESIRREIAITLLRRGCSADRTIVAVGDQCVNPHDVGTGPIPPNTSVIIDIFPRDTETGYWADMTRTVVRGKASKELRAMYDAVLAAQEYAFARIKGGVATRPLHEGVQQTIRDHGFETGPRNGRVQGFFHGTGHGVGLDIHEAPSFGLRDDRLPTGAVVTVEPGLYYEKLGGVRLEDMVLVQPDGCENLTGAPKVLEL